MQSLFTKISKIPKEPVNIFWYRRDLRYFDNSALFHALNDDLPVIPIYIFDNTINNPSKINELTIQFIYKQLSELNMHFNKYSSNLLIFKGKTSEIWQWIIKSFNVKKVFCNREYEPITIERDNQIKTLLNKSDCTFHTYKDHVIFEKNEILKNDGNIYTVFTPYSKKWKSELQISLLHYPSEDLLKKLLNIKIDRFLTFDELGFKEQSFQLPSKDLRLDIIKNYDKTRDIPSIEGTTKLGIHLRFGTVSIRDIVEVAAKNNEVFLNELIWREFFMMILWKYPHTETKPYKELFNNFQWINNESDFNSWCQGKTGYPIIDAGIRELLSTGFMHNRIRMIIASFLTKHLLVHWKYGEEFFAKHLLDYELSSNVGNWQWAAGSGCDAAPYFRIFNPILQTKKFDPDFKYIQKYLSEYKLDVYHEPIITLEYGRHRALEAYYSIKNEGKK